MAANGQAAAHEDQPPDSPARSMTLDERLAYVDERLAEVHQDLIRHSEEDAARMGKITHALALVVDKTNVLAKDLGVVKESVGALAEGQGQALAILARLDRADREHEGRIDETAQRVTKAEVKVAEQESTLAVLKRHAPGLAKYGGGTLVVAELARNLPEILAAVAKLWGGQ